MTDGVGGGSSNETESRTKKRRRKNDEFAHAIARIAVAQVCESVGFQGFQQYALDALSDVACRYIREIGKASSLYANLAGRTECNVFDIVQGLEDLNLSQGFLGASDRDSCFSRSGIIKEISQYVNLTEEIGFAYSVSPFPITKEQKSTPSFLESGETPPTKVIPPWLPKYPDPQTYTRIHSATTEETQTQMLLLRKMMKGFRFGEENQNQTFNFAFWQPKSLLLTEINSVRSRCVLNNRLFSWECYQPTQ